MLRLLDREVKTLVVSTPEFSGRSFATNVIDAVLVAITGRSPEDLRPLTIWIFWEGSNFVPGSKSYTVES